MNMSERQLRDIFGQSFFKKSRVQKGIPFCTLKYSKPELSSAFLLFKDM